MPAARRLIQQLRFSEAYSTGLMLESGQKRNMMHQRIIISKNPQQQSAAIAGTVRSICRRGATGYAVKTAYERQQQPSRWQHRLRRPV